MDTSPKIEIKALDVEFSRWGQSVRALEHVDLSIYEGQWVMLVGNNGSGKSTLLRAIAGQGLVSSGTIKVAQFKQDAATSSFDSAVFFVTQDPLAGTADALTLLENLIAADPLSSRANAGTGTRARQEVYFELMDVFGLRSRQGQLLKYFSGGERQQIAVSIAKLRNPSLLLLDEPFAALHADRIPVCLDILSAMHRAGCTIVQITHDTAIMNKYGNRKIVLEKGSVVNDASINSDT
jgi:putative tryptophan/tyrosine transport system ATP-binding protein